MTSARQTPDNSVIYVRHMVITRTSKLVEAPPDCPVPDLGALMESFSNENDRLVVVASIWER